MAIKTGSHTPLNSVCNPGVNGPNPTEGPNPTLLLERLWGTRKAGLNPFITLARAKDVKQDGQQ